MPRRRARRRAEPLERRFAREDADEPERERERRERHAGESVRLARRDVAKFVVVARVVARRARASSARHDASRCESRCESTRRDATAEARAVAASVDARDAMAHVFVAGALVGYGVARARRRARAGGDDAGDVDDAPRATKTDDDAPKKRPIVVYMDGCFDTMHYGHANALRQARACGDKLLVGVVNDAEIRRCKGPPVCDERERVEAVEACKWVDGVITDVPYEVTDAFTDELFAKHEVDYVIHGDDPCLLPDGSDAYAYPKRIGRYKEIKRTEGVSTTDIVGRLLRMGARGG